MRSYKPYFYCVFFLVLAGLRKAFPQQAEQVFAWLHSMLDPGGGWRAFVVAVGKALNGDDLREGLFAAAKLFGEVLA